MVPLAPAQRLTPISLIRPLLTQGPLSPAEREKDAHKGVRMAPKIPEKQLDRARKLRRRQTIAEEILWRALRDRQLGAKFRRQVPVGAFIADFACLEAKVIVEVDGPSHETAVGQVRDAWRDRWLRDNGWRVVRVTNEVVTGGGELALAPIRAALVR